MNASYDWYNPIVATSIASKISPIKGVDVSDHSLRVRVLIDVTVSIRIVVKVGVDGVVKPFLLQYKRLTDFCFRCGRCTSIDRECLVALDLALEANQFGKWLRYPTNCRTMPSVLLLVLVSR